jgi:hypothetical protein
MMTDLFSLKSLALAALLVLGSEPARADITVYTNQSAFIAAVSAPGIDSYDDLAPGFHDGALDRSAGSYHYTVGSENGLYGVGSGTDTYMSTAFAEDSLVFSGFSNGVGAFGGKFFGTDFIGEFIPSTSIVLTAMDGTTVTYRLDDATTDSFVGFVSSSGLASVSVGTGGANWPTANDVTLAMAAPVPEPGTWAMLLAGMTLLAAAARRRR